MKVKVALRWMLMSFVFLSVLGCDKYAREDFSFERQDYTGVALNTDGFYYKQKDDRFLVFFLYKNGVFHGGLFHQATNLKDLKNTISINSMKDVPYLWGIFQVLNENLIIEKWESGTGGPYPVFQMKAEILNDTTLLFDNSLYDTVYYHEFSPKPDSTNMWIN